MRKAEGFVNCIRERAREKIMNRKKEATFFDKRWISNEESICWNYKNRRTHLKEKQTNKNIVWILWDNVQ